MVQLPDEENFDRRWLHETTQEHQTSMIANLYAVKEFAYNSFDRLDKDGNGFIETHELAEVLENGNLSSREKSFVMFLLNNQEQISEMYDDGDNAPSDGISRQDIEHYFELIANLI